MQVLVTNNILTLVKLKLVSKEFSKKFPEGPELYDLVRSFKEQNPDLVFDRCVTNIYTEVRTITFKKLNNIVT